ncbi:MAG TPA: FtsX-like permease family protein [Bryobacteraceae bacterium]|nr:FtsX-like permease family protein [Bryobacteraceae bacterium]
MFLKFILRALKYRKQRLLLAFAALAVAAALATVLFNIYGSIERRLREQFSAYGANIAAVPQSGGLVSIGVKAAAEKQGGIAAPFAVRTTHIANTLVPLVAFISSATEPITPYWHVEGRRKIGEGECLAGETLAARLGLKLNAPVPADVPCVLRGIVSTGGAEDKELLIPLDPASSGATFMEIRVPGDRLASARAALSKQFPDVEFREIRAVADTESSVILKIRAALFLLTLVVLVITTLCVTGNFTEMVIERAKEIAILKALGAAERRIAAFFVSESAALALAATLAGYLAGLFAAAGIARGIFGGVYRIETDWLVFAGVAGVMLAVAAISTAIATSRIWTIEPAVILRGD